MNNNKNTIPEYPIIQEKYNNIINYERDYSNQYIYKEKDIQINSSGEKKSHNNKLHNIKPHNKDIITLCNLPANILYKISKYADIFCFELRLLNKDTNKKILNYTLSSLSLCINIKHNTTICIDFLNIIIDTVTEFYFNHHCFDNFEYFVTSNNTRLHKTVFKNIEKVTVEGLKYNIQFAKLQKMFPKIKCIKIANIHFWCMHILENKCDLKTIRLILKNVENFIFRNCRFVDSQLYHINGIRNCVIRDCYIDDCFYINCVFECNTNKFKIPYIENIKSLTIDENITHCIKRNIEKIYIHNILDDTVIILMNKCDEIYVDLYSISNIEELGTTNLHNIWFVFRGLTYALLYANNKIITNLRLLENVVFVNETSAFINNFSDMNKVKKVKALNNSTSLTKISKIPNIEELWISSRVSITVTNIKNFKKLKTLFVEKPKKISYDVSEYLFISKINLVYFD